eukprot:3484164-Pyramimonas_sp.AAC.1
MAPKKRRRVGAPSPAQRQVPSSQSQRDAGSELLRLLLSLYSQAKLSARDLCVLCKHASDASCPGGAFSIYGLPPNLQSGKYQRHLDAVLPSPKHLLAIQTPSNVNRSAIRSSRDVLVRCIWESLSDELENDPSIRDKLYPSDSEAKDSVVSLPAYQGHPAVVRNQQKGIPRPIPIAFYLDGIQFRQPAAGRNDNVLGGATLAPAGVEGGAARLSTCTQPNGCSKQCKTECAQPSCVMGATGVQDLSSEFGPQLVLNSGILQRAYTSRATGASTRTP